MFVQCCDYVIIAVLRLIRVRLWRCNKIHLLAINSSFKHMTVKATGFRQAVLQPWWSPSANSLEIVSIIHCVSKKFPLLNSLKLCQILTDFWIFCTAGKRMKFATKPILPYPPHLTHVATLPWKIKNSNFLQIFSRYGKMQTSCIFVAFNLVIDAQILIFSVFNIASFPRTDCE